ncbi:hypothetical protein RCC89_03010 [Cytophagaceae bacterium ABcell3]|nr:hypothetical protein RCC89_03010 [Cytophagaceae bacterium ABcell3]
MEQYKKIRAFESDILDKHHETYPFYHYSEGIVIPYLLQVYGDTERFRDALINKGHDPQNLSLYLNNMLHGMGHCIRWMNKQRSPKYLDADSIPVNQLQESAATFLNWGGEYHSIAQEFVIWSRGIKKAILDEENKTITFQNPKDYNYAGVYNKQVLYAQQMQEIYFSYPHEEMEKEFSVWIKDVDISRPPIANHIKWERGRYSSSYPLLLNKMAEILFPELPETTDFNGYNLKQLRQFYSLFFISFYFIRWVEAELDSRTTGESLSFGSNPLYLATVQFIKLASIITGLSNDVSKSIIEDLTFNPDNFHSSVTIQPFVVSPTGTYYILPNLFSQVEPSRMILGALNKGKKKEIYDRLINDIEKANLRMLGGSVREIKGCISFAEKSIRLGGKIITPDLLLIDKERKVMLIADYKHYMGPITASEVDYKIKELSKAIKKVVLYKEVLSSLSLIDKTCIDNFKISGLIITHKPLPVPLPEDSDVMVIDMPTFIDSVSSIQAQNKGLSELLLQIHHNEQDNLASFSEFESEIEVGEWKIKRYQHRYK